MNLFGYFIASIVRGTSIRRVDIGRLFFLQMTSYYLFELTSKFIPAIRRLQRPAMKARRQKLASARQKLALFMESDQGNLPNEVLKLIATLFYTSDGLDSSDSLRNVPQRNQMIHASAEQLQNLGPSHA